MNIKPISVLFILFLFSPLFAFADGSNFYVEPNFGEMTFIGNIEHESVRRGLAARIKDFNHCSPTGEGTIDLSFEVDGLGQKSNINISGFAGNNSQFQECFKSVLKEAYMPPASDEKSAIIKLSIKVHSRNNQQAKRNVHQEKVSPKINERPEPQETDKKKLACEAYQELENVNNQAREKDDQLRKLACDNLSRARVFSFYARQLSGLKNKADIYSEEYQKISGQKIDPKKDCGL